MQLVHLLLADLLWISLVLLTASVVAVPAAEAEAGVAGAAPGRGTAGRAEEALALGR